MKARYVVQLQRCLIEAVPHPEKPLDCKYLARKCNVSMCNYVIEYDVGHCLDLSQFCRNNSLNVNYEPSVFPAAIYRDDKIVPVVANTFDSGIIILTKVTHLSQVELILPHFLRALQGCEADPHTGNRHEHRIALHRGYLRHCKLLNSIKIPPPV